MTSIADGAEAERRQIPQRAWMRREGEYWTVVHRDTVVHLRDGKGLHYLAALILHPDVEVHASDLVTAAPAGRLATAGPGPRRAAAAAAELDATGGLGDAGAVLDATAKQAYRERLDELRADIEEAESFNDPERAARAREELEFLQRELAAAVGFGGRDRRSVSNDERARVNVTRALKGTIRKVGEQAPTLGRYLELGVKTGIFCSFHPPPGFEIRLGEPEAPPAPGAPGATADPVAAPPAHAGRVAPAPARALRTFVFVEIADALELAARLGDEEWRRLLAEHDAAVSAQARRFGGHAGARHAEQTLVVFDAPASGVLFAEAMVLDARAAGHALRAGVHTGESELLGTAFVGIAVHAAARVCSLARPGEVLVSSIVRDLVAASDLELTDRGVHALRGVTREWRLYGLATLDPASAPRAAPRPGEASAPIPLPPRLSAAAERPLFGRQQELARLRAALERARAGGRPFALVAGEPGIGKSRLAAEAAMLAHADGATVLHGRCDPDLGLPYQAFAGALAHYVQHAPPRLAERLRAGGGGALARLVPQLADGAAEPGAPDADRHVLFAEVAALLATNPWPPLVLVLDDLHWADRPTLALLRYLFGAPALGHLLVVGTYRSTEVDEDHALAHLLAELDSDSDGERLELGGLSQADILALTAQVVGRELPPGLLELARVLTLETRGNAFFLTEILRHLADSGELERDERAWQRRDDAPAIELPGNVLETIARRVTRLGSDAGDLLAIAATIGAEFDVGVLARAADVSEDQVLDLLDRAIAAGLVTAPADTGRCYRFAHALVGHTVYQRLAPGRRRRLHRRVAGAIEELAGGDAGSGRIAELANHVIRGAYAEDLPKALRYARQAGDRALEQLAPQEGERWYERALGLLNGLPADDAQRCDLLIGLGRAQCQSGNAAFRQTLLDATEIARRTGDRDRLVEAALANTRGFASATGEVDAERVDVLESALAIVGEDDRPVRARLLATLAAELTFSGDWERRRQLSDEALAEARRAGDPATLTHVLSARFLAIWTPETLPDRYADTAEELELAKRSGDRLARFRALHWRAAACVERGELEEAAALVTRESKLAEELGQPTASWLAAYDRATRALMRGLLDEAETQTEAAGRIARESGQPEAMAFYIGQLLNVRFEQGRLPELEPMIAAQVQANPGIPAFRAALALAYSESGKDAEARELLDADGAAAFSSLPYDSNWLVGLAIYAEACGQVGSRIAARQLYLLLEPWAEQVAFNSATVWGSVERHLGNLAAVFGRREEAEQRLRRAAEIHERVGAPIWLARTRLDLARVIRPGRREDRERRWLLEQAMSTARELGSATIERRAAALIEESPPP